MVLNFDTRWFCGKIEFVEGRPKPDPFSQECGSKLVLTWMSSLNIRTRTRYMNEGVGEEGGTSPLHSHSNLTSSWFLFKCQKTTCPFIVLLRYFPEYTECQAFSFSPVVRIGSPLPLARKLVLPPPPFGSKGMGHTPMRGVGGGAN